MTKKLLITASFLVGLVQAVSAQNAGFSAVSTSNPDAPGSYIAGIWVDPDGCQHWVMDLGIEGMMDSVLSRDGKPVCGRSNASVGVARAPVANCGQLSGDVLFGSGDATLSASGREAVQALALQLKSQGRNSVGVVGYTDADGSEGFNQNLSQNRATAVASVLQQNGVNTTSVVGLGESNPIASNSTAAGKSQNRRVEITCQ